MTEPTLSQFLRDSQQGLNAINDSLRAALALAENIGLVPFRIANIQAAINDNQHAWQELNELATALEILGPDFRDSAAAAPLPRGT